MAASVSEISLTLTNYLLQNWTLTPISKLTLNGADITNQIEGSLFQKNINFICIDFVQSNRKGAGISYNSGVHSQGFLDIEIYVELGVGDADMLNIEQQLCILFERKKIGPANVKPAIVSRPYELRGKLAKTLSFPVEFFSIPCKQ
jgi:hypothetical protein